MPRDLQQFINGGDPPVYMTFGSMAAGEQNPGQVTDIFSEAARLAGCRAIIQADWDAPFGQPEAVHVYRITQAPHLHIFPYCTAAALIEQYGEIDK